MEDNRDITNEIRQTDALGVLVWEAVHASAYRTRVPAWAWEMHKEKGQTIGWMLREAGITDEMVDLANMGKNRP